MEPHLPLPQSPEIGPLQPSVELPKHPVYEVAPLPSPEKGVPSPEQGNRVGPSVGGPPPLVPVIPVPQQSQQTVQPTPLADDDIPPTAKDDDLIEKEWVDKAKKVIAQTRHDPYSQQKEVSRLQAAYLQKRYGKTIKLPSDGQ